MLKNHLISNANVSKQRVICCTAFLSSFNFSRGGPTLFLRTLFYVYFGLSSCLVALGFFGGTRFWVAVSDSATIVASGEVVKKWCSTLENWNSIRKDINSATKNNQNYFWNMVSTHYSVFLVLLLMKHAQSLRYNFGDGSYYVGSVDNQGRPSGRGQYHNSSGDLGNFQTYYPFMPLLLQVLQAIQDML